MDPKIRCLKCGSYIHDTDRCWNWHERRQCRTDKKYKESCDCHNCKSKEICQYCNDWKLCCNCNCDRCVICNEYFKKGYNNSQNCRWDHTKSLCQFCKLPITENFGTCLNYHRNNNPLCQDCNMPEQPYRKRKKDCNTPVPPYRKHKHDGTLCKNCGTLLNYGKCINYCVNGGNRCVHCYWESVINNVCRICKKDQSGFLTKVAIK